MPSTNKIFSSITGLIILAIISGCSPEVGSEAWCQNLKEKPKGEWTANEASDYAKNCLFK
ncbi:MAG: DUF3012 domain-containing protein [Gammaproteobacteria bacterium]|nr:MAG: DUF3012 domain-containing protein [Gammaproteobacteria bacterium]